MAMSGFFHAWPASTSALYAGDLIGASLAALSAYILMEWIGPVIGTVFVGIAGVISLALAGKTGGEIRWKLYGLLSGLVIVLHLTVTLVFSGDLPIGESSDKDILQSRKEGVTWEIRERRWSSFGRTDLLESEAWRDSMGIYIDGSAGTAMYNANALQTPNSSFYGFPGLIPLRMLQDNQKDSALVIGAGAGRDVISLLLSGMNQVTAVEVNTDLVDIMREYEEYNGGLYSKVDRVNVVAQEGRQFVRKSSDKYDVIMMTLPITKSSRSVEGYALTENTLFTVEAFQDYLSRLTEEGQLIFVAHHEPEVQRLVSLALEAYGREGLSFQQTMARTALIGSMMPILTFSRFPINPVIAMDLYYQQLGAGFSPEMIYLPGMAEGIVPPESTAALFQSLENGSLNPDMFYDDSPWNISPTYDDSPFFYQFGRSVFTAFPSVLWILMIAVPLAILAYVRRTKLWRTQETADHSGLTIFVILGLAFMMVEIALFQKLNFVFPNPAASTSVLLASLLLGAGLGSIASRRRATGKPLELQVGLAAVAVVVPLSQYLLGLIAGNPSIPALSAVLVVVATGFVMGIPFPIALSRVKTISTSDMIPLYWAVNGAFSMVGAFLAMILGITVGFQWAGLIGAVLYALAVPLAQPVTIGISKVSPRIGDGSSPVRSAS
ncbi:MAG: hypothetical protein RQ801_00945 [Spirochaetaceae bacterium]|nr:hypothetical protein [Spirochaetaceae bacterium]